MTRPTVVKVGGSILRDEASYRHVAQLVADEIAAGPAWCVVSAANGVTDELERLACATDERDPRRLLTRQARASGVPVDPALEAELRRGVREAAAGRMERLLAWGEQASAAALRTHLARLGLDVPLVELSETGPTSVPAALVPGFYLRDRGGVRLLPRGGSDISAVLVAIRLGAPTVRFWKGEGGFREDGGVLREVDASTLLARLSGSVRPLHPEALSLAARWGIDLVLEDPFGRYAATRIVCRTGVRPSTIRMPGTDAGPRWPLDRTPSSRAGGLQ